MINNNGEMKKDDKVYVGLYFTKNFVEIFVKNEIDKKTSEKVIIYENIFNVNMLLKKLYKETQNMIGDNYNYEIAGVGIIVTNDFCEERVLPLSINHKLKDEIKNLFGCKVYVGSRASCILKKCMNTDEKINDTALISVSSEVDTAVMKNGEIYEVSNKKIFELDLIKLTKNMMITSQDSKMWELTENDIDLADDYTAIYSAIKGDEFALDVLNKYILSLVKYIVKIEELTSVKVILVKNLFKHHADEITNRLYDYVLEFSFENDSLLESKVKVIDKPYINMAEVAIDLIC